MREGGLRAAGIVVGVCLLAAGCTAAAAPTTSSTTLLATSTTTNPSSTTTATTTEVTPTTSTTTTTTFPTDPQSRCGGAPGGPPSEPPAALPLDPGGLTWRRVPLDETSAADAGSALSSVAAGGPGLVAVGHVVSDVQADAAVWVSSDGITWTRVAADEAVFGGPGDQIMADVVAGGPGLVAVGTDYRHAAVWVSEDGYEWERVSDAEAGFADGTMRSVTAGGPGLVAVGSVWASGSDVDPAVWVSPDGYTWCRVADEKAPFGGPGGQSITAVAAGGPGLVAVGSDYASAIAPGPPVWLSADGFTWERAPEDPAAFDRLADQVIASVAAGGPGLVAGGYETFDGFLDAVLWVSVDGYAWTRVSQDRGLFGGLGFQTVDAVLGVGTSLLAAGYDWEGGERDPALWISADGSDWTRVRPGAFDGGPPWQQILSLTVGGPGLVAVGVDRPDGEFGTAAVWVAEPAGG